MTMFTAFAMAMRAIVWPRPVEARVPSATPARAVRGKSFTTCVGRFFREEDAPTFFEYGLLVIVIALVVVVAAATVGTSMSQIFQNAASAN